MMRRGFVANEYCDKLHVCGVIAKNPSVQPYALNFKATSLAPMKLNLPEWMQRICLAVIFGLALAPVSFAQDEEVNGDLLSAAILAIGAEDWVLAENYGSQISDRVGADIVTWYRLRAGEGEWPEYQTFLARHQNWPGLKRLRRKGEAVIPKGEAPAMIRAYFTSQLPQTGLGSLKLAQALLDQGRTGDARAEIIRAWRELDLTGEEENLIQDKFNGIVSRHHTERLDMLLWKRKPRAAARMIELVGRSEQKLATTRIALQRSSKNLDELIEALSPSQLEDAGLAFDRFQWRVKNDRWNEAEELLISRTNSAEELGKPEKWSERRRVFARRAMRVGEYEKAYLLASNHQMTKGPNFADLEWLSGYLSLRFLDEPARALKHFNTFTQSVRTPISFGRAGYWRGRAYEALGDLDAAQLAYAEGARFQTSFYGQLAAEKIGLGPDQSLTGRDQSADWRDAEFAQDEVVRAAMLLHFADQAGRVRQFMTHLAEEMTREEASQLADLALELDRPTVALAIAKEVAKRGIVLARPYFPITDLASYSADVEGAVAMAIARRESELNAGAVSPAGARGLMQLMPATARQVAEQLGIEYSKSRLTNDWRYNATLGTAYLAGLLEDYRGSYVLSFAAYNAGPHRADAWLERYGDPRSDAVDPVDWIELIPFRETRNYVMRVIESLHVYRARMRGEAETVSLTADLNRG